MIEIPSTEITIDSEKALNLIKVQHVGLMDKILMLAYKNSKTKENVVSSRLIYYPHWVVGAKVLFARHKMESKIIYDFLVIDGYYGTISRVQGFPVINRKLVEENEVVKCRIELEKAREIAVEYLENKNSLKYKKVPEIQIQEILQVYKPNVVFVCENGFKRYYKAVDAETGLRNYLLDIKYKELEMAN